MESTLARGEVPAALERAGPREGLFFDPSSVRAGMVTCGGLCPGLNDVVRALTLCLGAAYGVREIFGFPYGYEGMNPSYGHKPVVLDPEIVDDIHQQGGTVLGSSRGPQPVEILADFLERERIDMLFTVGGDGTQRGAMALSDELARRGRAIAVVGVPKTIDNDIAWIEKSFGVETAVAMARAALRAAHVEAKGSPHGLGLVKLMGRESGFIATYAGLSNSEVDVVLIPEQPFTIRALTSFLTERLRRRRHAVVVVAEGAGQAHFPDLGFDASGNRRLGDIGLHLKEHLPRALASTGMTVSLKYIDPSYLIRSAPAIADDSVYCLELAQNAVHAAMSGRTRMLVGQWNGQPTHVPMQLAVGSRKRVDPEGPLWESLCLAIGQPLAFSD
jgi:6-phosphofructokinase 1